MNLIYRTICQNIRIEVWEDDSVRVYYDNLYLGNKFKMNQYGSYSFIILIQFCV